MLFEFPTGVAGIDLLNRMYISRSTILRTATSGADELDSPSFAILNAGDANGVTKTIDASNGVFANGSNANRYKMRESFAGAQASSVWFHFAGGATIDEVMQVNQLRGMYAIFARYHVDTGSSGDVRLQLQIGSTTTKTDFEVLGEVIELEPTVASGDHWQVAYMGQFTFPQAHQRMFTGQEGLGYELLDRSSSSPNVTIALLNEMSITNC